MASELIKNEFWVKKMAVRFNAMNAKKDGVASKGDLEILIGRIINIGKLNDAQTERIWKLLADELLPLFGGATFKLTSAEFNGTAAKSSDGIVLLFAFMRNALLLSLSRRKLPSPFGR